MIADSFSQLQVPGALGIFSRGTYFQTFQIVREKLKGVISTNSTVSATAFWRKISRKRFKFDLNSNVWICVDTKYIEAQKLSWAINKQVRVRQYLRWVLLSSRTPSPFMSDHGSQPIPAGSMSAGNIQSVLSGRQRYSPLLVGPSIKPHLNTRHPYYNEVPPFSASATNLLSSLLAHPAIAYSLVGSPKIW